MKNLIEILNVLKYRKQIIQLLRYSFAEVQEYRYLTTKEKQILRTEREFYVIKSL
jgi:hypothetical protein